MDNESKKLLQEQYAKLPKQLQDAIQSAHVHEQIAAIASANKLHIDQIGEFENEVMMLMMGFTDPIEFVAELQKTLNLSADAALKIATETNTQILLPIRESMEKATSDPTPQVSVPSKAPAVTMPPVSEGKSVVMPSSIAKSVGAEVAHSTPMVTPAQTAPVVPPPVTTPTAPATAPNVSATTPAEAAMMPTIIKPSGFAPAPKVDAMLSVPTVSIAPKPAPTASTPTPSITTPAADAAKAEVPKPGPTYKTDPYHEPID
jgi:hypothetical protein